MAGSASRMTLPPSPPSPPSGPPRGTNFSRRKLTQPAPPSPPLTNTSISSTNMLLHRGPGGPPGGLRRVGADAHVQAGLESGAPLPDQDGAARHELAGEALHAEHLGIGVSAVPGAAD